jgi:hypothetical protein
MARTRRRSVILQVLLLSWGLVSMAFPAHAAPNPAAAAPAAPYKAAAECGECHEAIYRNWSEGPHARSATSPVFLAALTRAADSDPEAPRTCVWCHAPTTVVTGDTRLERPLSREGITCDFCHTVVAVDMERREQPFDLDPGDVKRGPFEYSESPGHRTAYSPLHRASPLLCAACHEYRNPAGVAVLSTYSEWTAGPYPARGVPCQDCHMSTVPGATARDGLTQRSLRVVNQHRVVGGSARSQLARGLDVAIESLTRSGGSAVVTVSVTNVAAGHAVPGGLSTKSLVLAVGVETGDGTVQHRQERVYRRELKDVRGRVLTDVADLFLRAASVGRDNRIQPLETRRERFTLPLPHGARAIVARLEYRDTTDPANVPTMILVTTSRRDLGRR